MGVSHVDLQVPIAKVRHVSLTQLFILQKFLTYIIIVKCRKTMARIKMVLNERRIAYEGARKIVQLEHDEMRRLGFEKDPDHIEAQKIVEYRYQVE